MPSNVKVTKIKNGLSVGTPVPQDLAPGDIGIWVENQLAAKGYDINPGKGPDMADLGCEVKSRIAESRSARTIGASSQAEIVNTPYDDSHIKSKAQQIYNVTHSKEYGEVLKESIVDFSNPDCQQILKDGYEKIRQALSNVPADKKYVRGNDCVIAEKQSNGTWQVRLTHKGWQTLEAISEQQQALNEIMEF